MQYYLADYYNFICSTISLEMFCVLLRVLFFFFLPNIQWNPSKFHIAFTLNVTAMEDQGDQARSPWIRLFGFEQIL